MAMLESVESFTIRPFKGLAALGHAEDRVRSWLRIQRKYREVRRELRCYSPYELGELDIGEADTERVAMEIARGEPTRCRLVETGQKTILRGG